MIDEIVELILQEANKRPGKDMVSNIYAVMKEIEREIIRIIENLRIEERRNKENENKG